MKRESDDLSPRVRAEDIILGSLGYGEEATIVSIERSPGGFKGIARWADGEEFSFENDEELDELHEWALTVLIPLFSGAQRVVNS